ncbi:MAG: MBL fold metallo-hydrolase [Candidatus Bathycorpusculaceae bacterium]
MTQRASITDRGAVLLGKYVACDAFDETQPLRVITHAHADHMMGLRQSLRTCEKILMTKATKDLINVMRGPLFLMGGFVETLDYGKTIEFEDERVTFFKADHILGAAQVLVENAEGKRIVYTGDFKIENTPVLDADVLVTEATYGSPSCKRPFEADVKSLLVSLVEEGLKRGTVYIFGFHGKLQEVMQILHDAKVRVPFIAPERVFQISKVCEANGMRLGRLTPFMSVEARALVERNSPSVVFYHTNSRGMVAQECFRIYASGWEFNTPCRQMSPKEYIVALSDHSDFDGLMEYVRRSRPSYVITDNYRVGYAETLAKHVRRRLGIPASPLPKRLLPP